MVRFNKDSFALQDEAERLRAARHKEEAAETARAAAENLKVWGEVERTRDRARERERKTERERDGKR